MTAALSVTGRDLVRALSDAALAPVDDAVRERAEAAAPRLRRGQAVVRVLRRGPGHYSVEVTGVDLFAREFGSVEADASPAVGAAITREGQP
jgi:hypothetical protein